MAVAGACMTTLVGWSTLHAQWVVPRIMEEVRVVVGDELDEHAELVPHSHVDPTVWSLMIDRLDRIEAKVDG